MSTNEVGISDFFWAKNRQMANFIVLRTFEGQGASYMDL
jgi:hypothetical protein